MVLHSLFTQDCIHCILHLFSKPVGPCNWSKVGKEQGKYSLEESPAVNRWLPIHSNIWFWERTGKWQASICL